MVPQAFSVQNEQAMAELRIRVELNKGRVGMPLNKLVAVSSEILKFLSMIVQDLRLATSESVWLAERFENNSVDFDCRFAAALDEQAVQRGNEGLKFAMGDPTVDPMLAFQIRSATCAQFTRITLPLDADEVVRLGTYNDEGSEPKSWYEFRHVTDTPVSPDILDRKVYSEIQGVVNAFFKENKHPHIRVRDLCTGRLVKCFFDPEMYEQVVGLLSDRSGVIFVEGYVREDADTGETAEIDGKYFRLAPEFDPDVFDHSLGSIPDYTGLLTTEQYVEQFRERG